MALQANELAAGIEPYGELFQVWYSSTGIDINWLSAHRDRAQAEEALRAFVEAARGGALSDLAQARVFKALALSTDATPQPVGDALTLKLAAQISQRAPDILFVTLPGAGVESELE